MRYSTPIDTILTLVDARNRGDIETALSCYETQATIIIQPGQSVMGMDGTRSALQGFVALQPTFSVTGREILESGDIALHYSRWTLHGTAPSGELFDLAGKTTDVLRRQEDGRWLLVIDNPWGTDILG